MSANPQAETAELLRQILALGVFTFALIMLIAFTSMIVGTLMNDWRERRRRRSLLIRRFPRGLL